MLWKNTRLNLVGDCTAQQEGFVRDIEQHMASHRNSISLDISAQLTEDTAPVWDPINLSCVPESLHQLFFVQQSVYAICFDIDSIIAGEAVREGCVRHLKRSLSTIHLHTYDSSTKLCSQILLIGCTCGGTTSSRATIQEASRLIRHAFLRHPAWTSVVLPGTESAENGDATNVFFTVRRSTNAEIDGVDLAAVRNALFAASAGLISNVPLSWHTAAAEIAHEATKCHTLSDITTMCAQHDIPAQEVPVLLAFLHQRGEVLWRDLPGLRESVLSCPVHTVLLLLTSLLTDATVGGDSTVADALLQARAVCQRTMPEEFRQLRHDGLLHRRLLLALWSPVSAQIQEHALAYLTHMHLLVPVLTRQAPAGSAEQYFVPALRPAATDSDLATSIAGWDSRCALFIVFSLRDQLEHYLVDASDIQGTCFLPEGLFERIVGTVLSWSQDTARGGRLGLSSEALHRDMAMFASGQQRFRLVHCPELQCVRVDIEGGSVMGIQTQILNAIGRICRDDDAPLRYFTAVVLDTSANASGASGSVSSAPLRGPLNEHQVFVPVRKLHRCLDSHQALRANNRQRLLEASEIRSRYGAVVPLKPELPLYDVFISYRWNRNDYDLAERLYETFGSFQVQATAPGKRALEVFLDWKRAEVGPQFIPSFSLSIPRALVGIPVVSVDALDRMLTHSPAAIDNVLLEWTIMLECFVAKRMKQIYPILLGERAAHLTAGVRDFLQDNTRDRLPNTVPMATLAQARRVLNQCRVPISAHFSTYTVHSIVQQLLQFTSCNAAYIDYFDLEYNVAERVTAVLEDYFALERSGDVSALVARALQRGSKEWRRSKLSVVGEGRAGKTALTNAILGRAFHDTESTVGINQLTCDVSHIRSIAAAEATSASAQHWREFNKQDRELESALAEVVALSRARIANGTEDSAQDGGRSIPSLLAGSAPAATVPAASFAATTLPRRLQSLQLPANGGRQTPMSPSSSDSGSSTPLPTVVRAAQLAASVTQTASERPLDEDMLLRALGTVEDAASGLLITLFDFGGQSVFDVIHHLFLTRNGVYAVVFNMERLVVDGPDKECALKLIHRWLSSIAAHTFDTATCKTAPIVLVGTRADAISDPLTHESVSQLLYDSFSDNPAWPSVISNSYDTFHLWFFPVSNPDGCGSPTMRHLMNVVHDSMDQALYTHKEVPLSWFKVMDHIRDSERDCLSLSEVTAIGARCQVSERELLFMLKFLHDMGHLMWLDEPELRDVVILDPVKYLVVPATILICNIQPSAGTTEAVHHTHPSHRECMHKCKDEWNALLKGGVLHTKLLPILWKDYQSDADILLPLMVKYGLLVPLRSTSGTGATGPAVSTYLVPALLMPTRESDHDALHWTDLEYVSVHLVFTLTVEKLESFGVIETADLQSYGFLPGGMFERVVGKALSWSQDTARGGRLNLRSVVLNKDVAVLSFGRQRFRLVHCPDMHCVRVDIEGSNPIGLLQKLLAIVDKIIAECMPSLQCLPAVSFAPPPDSASSTDSSRLRKLLRPNEVLVPLDHLRAAARGQATLTRRGGRTLLSEEDVRTRYAPWLQLYSLRTNYDVFISYRWGDFDTTFTEQLFDMFTNFSVGTDCRAVEVFLDKKCLQKGQLFKADFAAALTHSDVVLPILSVDALDKMLQHDPSVVDNVLLEWVMIHETFAAQRIKKVYPIAFGKRARVGRTGNDIVIDCYFADQIRNQLPKVIPTETLSAAARLLEANGITPTSKLSSYTVFSIVHEMADFLLCEAHIHSASELVEAYSKEVVQLVRECITAAGGASGSTPAQAGDASTAASAASAAVPVPPPSSYISAQVVPPAVPTVRPLDQLSVQEVCQLIEQMGFPELSTVFAQKRVTGVKLRMCTKAENLLTAHFGVAEDFVAEGLFEYIALWKRDGVTL